MKSTRKVFPVINGQRRINTGQFETMLSTMRNHLWDYPIQENTTPMFRIAALDIPLGSLAMKEGYVTPEGYWLSKEWKETRHEQILKELTQEFEVQMKNKREMLQRRKAVERVRRCGGQVSLRWFLGYNELAQPEELAEERRCREAFIESIRSEN